MEPHHSGEGEEKGDKGASCSTDNIIPYSLRSPIAMWSPTHCTHAEPETTTSSTDIRDSSKRKQAVQVWTRVGKVDTRWRRSGVQVSTQLPVPVGASNDSRKTLLYLTRQIPTMT